MSLDILKQQQQQQRHMHVSRASNNTSPSNSPRVVPRFGGAQTLYTNQNPVEVPAPAADRPVVKNKLYGDIVASCTTASPKYNNDAAATATCRQNENAPAAATSLARNNDSPIDEGLELSLEKRGQSPPKQQQQQSSSSIAAHDSSRSILSESVEGSNLTRMRPAPLPVLELRQQQQQTRHTFRPHLTASSRRRRIVTRRDFLRSSMQSLPHGFGSIGATSVAVSPSMYGLPVPNVVENYDAKLVRLHLSVEQQHRVEVQWFWEHGMSRFHRAMRSVLYEQNDTSPTTSDREYYDEEVSLQALSETELHSDHPHASQTLVEHFAASATLQGSPDSLRRVRSASSLTGAFSAPSVRASSPLRTIKRSKTSGSSSPGVSRHNSSSALQNGSISLENVAGSLAAVAVADDQESSNADDGEEVSDDSYSSASSPLASSRILRVEDVYGLHRLRGHLEEMLTQPKDISTRNAFTEECPPQRRLFIKSDPGSGVSTLVKAMCKRHKINMLIVPVDIDVTFRDDMFLHIIEYARLIQPCVVLFDRCDAWWSNQWFSTRGEKFIMWLRTFRNIDKDNVSFIFSGSEFIESTHVTFRNYIGFRTCLENGTEENDRLACYCGNFKRMIHNLRESFELLPTDIEEIIEDALSSIYELCKEYAADQQGFTPSMIREFCERVMASARTRGINTTGKLEKLEIVDVIPVYNDFTWVKNCIERTTPGTICWRL